MHRCPPDLLFVPSYVIPPIYPPSVVTIHDLGYLLEPDCHPPFRRRQLIWSTRWNAHAASAIIAVSHATRNDLIEHLHVEPDRIRVIHHGISPKFAPASKTSIEAIRQRYSLGDCFILAVGTIHPRKNLIRLVQAFEQLAADDLRIRLVLCGALGWEGDSIIRRVSASPVRNRIVHLGYLPDEELPALYSAAAVFAFPSLYEGFGMPLLESMACGTPVVTSNRSALPEIAGGSAILVDPLDPSAIAAGIHRVLYDEQLRESLVTGGFERVKSFGWRKCAGETLAFLRSVGENTRR